MKDQLRIQFEEWVSSPPREFSIERWNDEWISPSGRQYKDICVQLAWEAWKESNQRN